MQTALRKINKGFTHAKAGFTIVEVLVACSIIAIAVFSLMSAAQKGIELSNLALNQAQANYLLEEGAEAVKSIRDTNWTTIANLTPGTTYFLSFNNTTNTWSLTTTSSTVDSFFTRTVIISTVNRDANDDIATSGTLDVGTKKVSVQVSWLTSSGTKTKNLDFYISNIFN